MQPEDRYVNVFYFQPDVTPGTLATLSAAIKNFYSSTPAGETHPLTWYLSGVIDAPGATVKMYDLDDAKPRATVFEETYTPAGFGGSSVRNLPNEVALCLSYSAGPASGQPIARRRGRLYLGPWSENALATAGLNAEATPEDALRDLVPKAAQEMASVAAGAGYDWSVYSPTDDLAISILSCWCDNAWDTQRRRGNKPTARTTELIST